MDAYMAAPTDFREEVLAYVCAKHRKLKEDGNVSMLFTDSMLRTAFVIKTFFDVPCIKKKVHGVGTRALIKMLRRAYGTYGKSQFFALKRDLS